MQSEPNCDVAWENYCLICEWAGMCKSDKPCSHFCPIDDTCLRVAEVVDDQDMRQRVYLGIVRQFGGVE